jgi:protocatechuate 3,4-dioxygenase beta subunit
MPTSLMQLGSSPLLELDLYETGIGPSGAKALAKALADPTCPLVRLSLFGNVLGDQGTELFAAALEVWCTCILSFSC